MKCIYCNTKLVEKEVEDESIFNLDKVLIKIKGKVIICPGCGYKFYSPKEATRYCDEVDTLLILAKKGKLKKC